jgi:hypothetical protein
MRRRARKFSGIDREGETQMTTSEELEIEKQRTEGARISFEFLKWLLAHGIVFKQCAENSAAIESYLREKNLGFTLPTAVEAYNELTKRGHKFVLETLVPPTSVEKELPPLPEVPGMGEPQIFTATDLREMPRERYRRLYFGPHSAEFRARVNEIIRREKAAAAKEEQQ